MATNELGVEVPAGGDVFDPQGDMVDLAASLAGRIVVPVANETERDALAAAVDPSPDQPLYVHRVDAPHGRELERTTDGSAWDTIPGTPAVPYATAAGSISTGGILVPGGIRDREVVFPAGRFTVAPVVTATTGDDQGRYTVSVISRTPTGMTLRAANRSSAEGPNATIFWQAVQMTPDSAAG